MLTSFTGGVQAMTIANIQTMTQFLIFVTFLPWTAPDCILTGYDYSPSYNISHGLVIRRCYHMYDTDSFLGSLY